MRTIIINTDRGGCARAVRASYGKCGFMSACLSTGMGITAVAEIYDDKELRPERAVQRGVALLPASAKAGDRAGIRQLDNEGRKGLTGDRDI